MICYNENVIKCGSFYAALFAWVFAMDIMKGIVDEGHCWKCIPRRRLFPMSIGLQYGWPIVTQTVAQMAMPGCYEDSPL